MVNTLIDLISKYGNNFIIYTGIIIFVLMMANGVRLSNSKSRIKENLSLDGATYALNLKEEKVEGSEDQKIVITPTVIRQCETKFNEACTYHDILAQLIPIFPLLGILGTVAGLMSMVGIGDATQASDALTNLYSGMGTALSTTLYGLIISIALKFVDAVFSSRIINDVDVMIEDFNNKLELAGMFKRS